MEQESHGFTTELSVFLAGVVAHLGEIRVPVSTFEINDKGISITFDEATDELVFSLEDE